MNAVAIKAQDREDIFWQSADFDSLDPDTLYQIMRLRQDIFILEQQCFYRDADGLDRDCHFVFGTYGDGIVVACARILPPGMSFDEPAIGRVVVSADLRGKGVGHSLTREAIAIGRQFYPGRPLFLRAQTHLASFYGRLGFVPIGDPYPDAGISHCVMRLPPEP